MQHSQNSAFSLQNKGKKPYSDYKCEWDVPKVSDLQNYEIKGDLYDSELYSSLLPNFGFFQKIK